jgi:uncharacterized phage protein (TIGR01671 family)
MREIKFKFVIDNKYISRAYSLDEIIKDGIGEDSILENMGYCDCNLNESVSVCEGDCLEFENSTITNKIQFTGLKDKNGVEIYEGDVFTYEINTSPDGISSAHNISYWLKIEATVELKNGRFIGIWKIDNLEIDKYKFTDRQGSIVIPKDFEIIGNIYENNNLIKE